MICYVVTCCVMLCYVILDTVMVVMMMGDESVDEARDGVSD